MWWAAQSEAERALQSQIFRLNDNFLTPSRTILDVSGVGSAVVDGERVPLIMLDQAFLQPTSGRPLPLRLFDRALHSSIPMLGLLFEYTAMAGATGLAIVDSRDWRARWRDALREDLLTPLSQAPADVRRLLARWDPPATTHLLFATSPQPLFGLGRGSDGLRLWHGENDATSGVTLQASDGRLFGTTAGHLVGPQPQEKAPFALERRTGWWRKTSQVVGRTLFSSDPQGRAGPDIALFELSPGHVAAAGGVTTVTLAQPPTDQDFDVTLVGGRSGVRPVRTVSALMSVRTLHGEPRIWSNVWNVTEKSDGAAQRGDSGGLAFMGEAVLGHIVAAHSAATRAGIQKMALVQDIHDVLTHAQKEAKLAFQPVIDQPVIEARNGRWAKFIDWLYR